MFTMIVEGACREGIYYRGGVSFPTILVMGSTDCCSLQKVDE